MTDQLDVTLKIVLDAWNSHLKRTNDLLDALSDEQLQEETAPGRNTGIYLLGHLAAVHDRMLVLLGIGEQLHPELEDAFIKSPDKSGKEMPAPGELRGYWKEINELLAGHFNKMEAEDWFLKHSAVSEEDFAREPHRNRLNILISRTNHLAYHLGQLAFLKK